MVLISLILCHSKTKVFFLFRGYRHWDRNLFTPTNFIQFLDECNWSGGKSRSRSIKTALLVPWSLKKSWSKVAHFYCRKAFRDWSHFQDPQILTVGNPIESKDVRLLGQLFWRDDGTKRVDLILLLRLFPSDQKHSTRNCIKFVGVKRFRSQCR